MKQIFHPYWKWECFHHGMYNSELPDNLTIYEGKMKYKEFLSNLDLFENSLEYIINNWKYSCEHFLTNPTINKIAWLGQSSVAYKLNIPCKCRGGFNFLTIEQQKKANILANIYYNLWLKKFKSTLKNGNYVDIQLEFQMKFL